METTKLDKSKLYIKLLLDWWLIELIKLKINKLII